MTQTRKVVKTESQKRKLTLFLLPRLLKNVSREETSDSDDGKKKSSPRGRKSRKVFKYCLSESTFNFLIKDGLPILKIERCQQCSLCYSWLADCSQLQMHMNLGHPSTNPNEEIQNTDAEGNENDLIEIRNSRSSSIDRSFSKPQEMKLSGTKIETETPLAPA